MARMLFSLIKNSLTWFSSSSARILFNFQTNTFFVEKAFYYPPITDFRRLVAFSKGTVLIKTVLIQTFDSNFWSKVILLKRLVYFNFLVDFGLVDFGLANLSLVVDIRNLLEFVFAKIWFRKIWEARLEAVRAAIQQVSTQRPSVYIDHYHSLCAPFLVLIRFCCRSSLTHSDSSLFAVLSVCSLFCSSLFVLSFCTSLFAVSFWRSL